jgi:cellulose synthase/poly-beta-1,6-N-acetylglucosamine synthase-like glycosyltransferase
MSVVIFWTCVALIAYIYAGFPLLLALRAVVVPRPYRKDQGTPKVSLIIAAHNEAASIGAKLTNILALDYPREQLEVIVASDGSTDGTGAIVRQLADPRVQLLSLPRRGKAAALNAAVSASSGEVLVFSDANSIYDARALRALVAPLADSRVGGVAGDQQYLRSGASAHNEGERGYWNYDRWLKRWQSAAGNVTSATGAIYAIRRQLFTTVPEGVTDDFAISTAVIAQSQRLVFAEDAVAYEPPAPATDAEFARKVRIISRGLRGVVERRGLLNPLRYGFYSLQLFSHKVLRRLVALPLVVLLAGGPWLWNAGSLYQAAILGQLAFYSAALLGWLLRGTRLGRLKLLALPLFFCMVNMASMWALFNVLRGRRIVIWSPARQNTPAESVVSVS